VKMPPPVGVAVRGGGGGDGGDAVRRR